jgi:phosphoribosyl-AMP cyclohydrolase
MTIQENKTIDTETPDHVFQRMRERLWTLNTTSGQMKDLEYE